MAHFTYLDSFISEPIIQKLACAGVLGAGMLLIGKSAASKLKTANGLEASVIPDEKIKTSGLIDLLISSFIKYHDSILGKENRKYFSLSATVFFFIFFANLIGLIPGVPAITTTVTVNVAMALVVFVAFNYYGIKEQGLVNYLKHFTGGMASGWLAIIGIFIFLLEIVSTCLRVLTLNLRLYWNITADHLVLGTFMDLVPVVPIAFYAMGTFVAFMQAFVFATLTMIYILLAVEHAEDHH
ncbi:MAG: F0F1 ATP synthase subunit A [Bdellovibrionales bacterium]|nr:F0F1 ATP synthase subunit A [Bdellovibrionales bacterium]